MKRCTKCGNIKPEIDFYDGHLTCKMCIKQRRILGRAKAQEYSQKQIDRFWSHVDRRKPEQCWNWKLRLDADGYGTVTLNYRLYHASRIAWIFAHGDPGDLIVCHTCDNRACCNPAHLFLGTNKDNSEDMAPSKGEKNGHHKLTDAQVAEIRRLHSQGVPKRALGRQFNTDPRNITFIVRMETRV